MTNAVPSRGEQDRVGPRLLLLSNSRNPGQAPLAHALQAIANLLGPVRELTFIPYAGVTITAEEYTTKVREALEPIGVAVRSVTEARDPVAAVRTARAVAVGGGNSFQLLKRMYETGLLGAVRTRVTEGVPYLGWSAGSNLACPTIRTTNDMPVVEPPSLVALGFVPFQINPHYTDRVLPDFEGETRDERIGEFLRLNPEVRVVGLREGSWLERAGSVLSLHGPHALRLFEYGRAARDIPSGGDLSVLLG